MKEGVGERRTEGLRAIESELLSEIERDAEVVEWAVLCLLKQAIMVKTRSKLCKTGRHDSPNQNTNPHFYRAFQKDENGFA